MKKSSLVFLSLFASLTFGACSKASDSYSASPGSNTNASYSTVAPSNPSKPSARRMVNAVRAFSRGVSISAVARKAP